MPHDIDAERAVLGAMLLNRDARETAAAMLTPASFYRPQHGVWFAALAELHGADLAPDRVVLVDRLAGSDAPISEKDIRELQSSCPVSFSIASYAQIVERCAIARRMIEFSERLAEHAWDGEVDEGLAAISDVQSALDSPVDPTSWPMTGVDLAQHVEAEVQWVVHGLLARQEAVLFVAEPGSGKTTLLNQIAVLLACGLHPWTRVRMPKRRVLVFDFQDSPGARARGVRKMLELAGDYHDDESMLRYEVRPEGIDLTQRADRRWMEAKVNLVRPDLLVMGPLYNMVSGDAGRSKHSEETAQIAGSFLAHLIVRYDCALLMEAHAPHGDELRVRGSKYWEDWAAFGFGLKQSDNDGRREFVVTRFRGDREVGRQWPRLYVQGHPGHWPWDVPPAALPPDMTHGGTDPLEF